MDNLTHTLIGIVAGDAVARSTAVKTGGIPAATRRSYFVTLAAVSSSLPDIDLLYTYGGFGHGKLEYLLHHRGHTHTIVSCILLALVLYACAELWALLRKHRFSSSDRMGIAGMVLLGGMLHLLMDGMNSYGVHPYWPLENRWIYGDAVFIIEPLLWIAATPLIFSVRTWLARVVFTLAAVAALGIGILLVQTGGGRYVVRNGIVATAPAVLPARNCPDLGFGVHRTAHMTPVQAPSSSRVAWHGEFAMDLADLAKIIEGNCEAAQLMQFARVPFAVEREKRQVLGDLRYDREPELGFAEIELSDTPPVQCKSSAPWVPPREVMLRSILQATGPRP